MVNALQSITCQNILFFCRFSSHQKLWSLLRDLGKDVASVSDLSDCKTDKVLYLIWCPVTKHWYLGATKRCSKQAWKLHLRSMIKFSLDNESPCYSWMRGLGISNWVSTPLAYLRITTSQQRLFRYERSGIHWARSRLDMPHVKVFKR